MKNLTKRALLFVFAVAIVFSGIYLIGNAGSGGMLDDKNTMGDVVSLNAPEGNYNNAADSWYNFREIYTGSGTSSDPYLIGTPEQLAEVSYQVNNATSTTSYTGKYFKLTADIDLSAHYWIPIGNYRPAVSGVNAANRSFAGFFNGDGFKVSGVFVGNPGVQSSELQYAGFFGYISGRTDIENLTVESYIQNTYKGTGNSFVGALAGHVFSGTVNITNCSTEGHVITLDSSGGWSGTGGLLGRNAGTLTIDNCHNIAEISLRYIAVKPSWAYAGGLVADIRSTTKIIRSFNLGKISNNAITNNRVGGLVGAMFSATDINDSYSTGDITLESSLADSFAGGLVGYEAGSRLILENSFCTGNIDIKGSARYAGGLLGNGESTATRIRNCFATGNVNAGVNNPDYLGGLVGNFRGQMENCYYNSSAQITWDDGQSSKNSEGAGTGSTAGSGGSSGKTEQEMTTQDFLDLLNDNNGDGSDWILTDGVPGLADVVDDSFFIVTFDYNDGSGITRKVSQPETGNYRLPSSLPVREEFSFEGWFENPDGTGRELTDSIAVGSIKNDQEESISVFYAHWRPSEVSYKFEIEIYDQDGNLITDIAASSLVSATSAIVDSEAPLSSFANVAGTSIGYRFLRFEIAPKNGGTAFVYAGENLGNGIPQSVFVETLGYTGFDPQDPPLEVDTIIIKAVYMKQYKLSFPLDNAIELENNAIVSINIGGEIIKRYFENRYYDKGTIVNILVVLAPDKFEIIKNSEDVEIGNSFALDSDTEIFIEIEDAVASIGLGFDLSDIDHLSEPLQESLTPRIGTGQNIVSGMERDLGTVIVMPNDLYTLKGWKVFVDGIEIDFEFDIDNIGSIKKLNIARIVQTALAEGIASSITDIETITLKPLWVLNIGLIVNYKEGSNETMGGVIYLRDGDEISVLDINENDEITVKLIPNNGYEYVGNETYIVTIDGIKTITIEFKPINYTVSLSANSSKNAEINTNAVMIGNNIVIDLKIGFSSKFNNLKVLKAGDKDINSKYYTIQGSSLIINANEEFLSEYAINNALSLEIDYSTKINPMLVVVIGVSGALIIAAMVLITLYVLRLKKKKIELKKAEIEYQKGLARLSISDNLKSLREGD